MEIAMKKKIPALLCALALSGAVALTGCSSNTEKETLNLFTWEGTFPEDVLDEFEATTGIRINYVNFDYDETMLAKLQAANGGDYDLVIADDYIIETAIAEGLVAKLDAAKLQNLGNVNPLYKGQFYDPSDEYSVPYGAGIQTIIYNPAKVDVPIEGYADLWNPALANRVGITSNYRVIDGMALKVLGKSYNTNDAEEIAAAGEKLKELAPNIRLIKDDNLQDDLLSGEIDAAVMYTSQVTLAKMTNPELEIVFPEEGIGFGVMAMFIPSAAPNSEAAYRFIDFILQPEIGARCYEYLGYYCTSSAAEEFISAEYRDFLTLPEGLDAERMEMIGNISVEAQAAHAEAWTAFKNACD